MVRPLYYDTVNTALKEMSDANMERLAYYALVAYATWIETANNRGSIFVGSNSGDLTNIGSASDTSSTQQSASNPKPGTEDTSDDNAYPAYPGLGTETDNTYNYQERKDPNVGAFGGPSTPTDTHWDKWGWVGASGSGGDEATLSMINNLSQMTELLSVIDTQMQSNYVGTYFVATSAPSRGGAGTWEDKGTWFVDSTYSAGSTTYKLWLKRDLTSIPGSDIFPIGFDSGGPGAGSFPNDWALGRASLNEIWQKTNVGVLQEKPMSDTSNLITQLVLKQMIYRGGTTRPIPKYTVRAVAPPPPGAQQMGTWTDTRQTTASNSQSFVNPNYISTSTPSGSATVNATYELIAEWS